MGNVNGDLATSSPFFGQVADAFLPDAARGWSTNGLAFAFFHPASLSEKIHVPRSFLLRGLLMFDRFKIATKAKYLLLRTSGDAVKCQDC